MQISRLKIINEKAGEKEEKEEQKEERKEEGENEPPATSLQPRPCR
jgi:hypothetical protein